MCVCAAVAPRTALKGGDCYDKNKNVYPGQGGWFTTERGDGSFDYNCDNKTDKQYGSGGKCSGTFWICNANKNFTADVGCGQKGDYVTGCSVFSCNENKSKLTQTCH